MFVNHSILLLDLLVFDTSKIFSPKYYLSDEVVCITMSKQWLESSIIKFGLMAVESDASRLELLEFVETLRHECENISLYKQGNFVGHQQVPTRGVTLRRVLLWRPTTFITILSNYMMGFLF